MRSLFYNTCPTLVSTRWGYVLDVTAWTLHRREALQYIGKDESGAFDGKEFSAKEIALLTSVLSSKTASSNYFWGFSSLIYDLAEWGGNTNAWFKGCDCHINDPQGRAKCLITGRRAIQLSCGEVCLSVE